jgi:hypothetical protein
MRFDTEKNQVVLHTESSICTTAGELLHSSVFRRVVEGYCRSLVSSDSPLLEPFIGIFGKNPFREISTLIISLADHTLPELAEARSELAPLMGAENRRMLHEFVEGLYDYWRHFDRFLILHSEPGKSNFDRRPYRAFNATIETLTHVVRGTYRDICENITGDHPRIYRQIFAGCDVSLIAVPKQTRIQESCRNLDGVPFIRHVWIAPPMIIDPPMNKRSGQFLRIDSNPIHGLEFDRRKWLCYPAQVGPLTIFIYFHQRFIGLGSSLANLFELASDQQITAGPDAVYCFGIDPGRLRQYEPNPVVFYEDPKSHVLIAAAPAEDRFGYFGYLKKMVLTLHNIVMMRRGRMPYHGAMVHIALKNGRSANLLIIGDTATGKSESLEAFRLLGSDQIRRLRIIADDMGSFDLGRNGRLIGYGTEIGAFVRLDDLQAGYAFEQIDRAIIMSPQKINARAVLPVTTLHEVLQGFEVDYLLYANNYEQVDDKHPILEQFGTAEQALAVFREGASMSKGTTTASGLVHSYFANIFGPPQYHDLHDKLAEKVFNAAFKTGIYVGQLRTRLGIPGMESEGPTQAARRLFEVIGQAGAAPSRSQKRKAAGKSRGKE